MFRERTRDRELKALLVLLSIFRCQRDYNRPEKVGSILDHACNYEIAGKRIDLCVCGQRHFYS
jgi:hypothetical protein